MHFCQTCRWSGTEPKPLIGSQRLAALDALKPGAIVPSAICPECDAHTIPAEIGPFAIPDNQAQSTPWEGPRWSATLSLTPHSFIVGLYDRVAPRFAEIVFDAAGQRPRFDLSVSSESENFLNQEPQLSASIGDGHVACYPAADPATMPVIFTNDGMVPGELMTVDEFEDLNRWTKTPQHAG